MLKKKKGNPEKLRKLNNDRKEKTLQSIRDAVDELNSFGYIPTIKRIKELTNLSTSAFQLPHIKDLLIELKIGKYGAISIDKDLEEVNLDDYIKLKKQVLKQKEQINLQKKKIDSISIDNEELQRENDILRMEIYELKLFQDMNMPVKRNKKNQ